VIDISLQTVECLLRGAVGVARGETGIVPERLPEWAMVQAPDDLTREIFRFASGVRLALTTEATTLEIDVAVSQVTVGDNPLSRLPLLVDLLIDCRRDTQQTVGMWSTRFFDNYEEGALIDATPQIIATLRFEGLPNARKVLELWFPPNGVVEVCALRADAELEEPAPTLPRWIHHGSSISHGFEAHSPTRTWPVIAASLGGLDLLNLGFAGNCQLDPFVARTIRDLPAAFISLKVGINIAGLDSLKFRTFAPAVHGFLDTIRDGHSTTPLLVISPIICPGLERQPGPWLGESQVDPSAPEPPKNALSLRRMREILAEIVESRVSDDPNLHYLDGLALFGESDVTDLPDGVHPNADGHVCIGQRFAATVFASDGAFPSQPAAARG
jgi:GDSL-like Lipase/Acylhydrolase family